MKKRHFLWRKGCALLLSVAMTGTFLPATVQAGELETYADAKEISTPLLADFTFDDEASVLAGGNAKAAVKGTYQLQDSRNAEN